MIRFGRGWLCLSSSFRHHPDRRQTNVTRVVFADIPENSGGDLSIERSILGADVRLVEYLCDGDEDHLVAACKDAGVKRILFISSIAVKFPDKRSYHYAQSKELAEDAVIASGLTYTIVRVTPVLGVGSPVLSGLTRLASLPIMPIFGSGLVKLQPIFVDNLIDALLRVLDDVQFSDKTIEVGGKEVVSVDQLLTKLRTRLRGTSRGSAHIPLGPVLPIIRALERIAPAILPVTSGQLSSFRFDGVAELDPLLAELSSTFKSVDEMLDVSLAS